MRNSYAGWMTRATALLGIVLMAGCATTGVSLSSSAERLERSSTQLERNADDTRVRSHARDLADESRDFRHVVSDSRADRRDVRTAFDDLSRNYHALRNAVEKSRDRSTERDFDAVTSVYLDIEREVNLNDLYATLTD